MKNSAAYFLLACIGVAAVLLIIDLIRYPPGTARSSARDAVKANGKPTTDLLAGDTMTPELRDTLEPPAWVSHWQGMPNNVRALYATFQLRHFPWTKKEVLVYDAHGQLCFDSAANSAVAHHMWNNMPNRGSEWRYLSWRAVMDKPPVAGGKLSGQAPSGFRVENYVH